MERVNIHQTKTHLSRMLERVAAGEEFIIAKAGKPVAKLVPYRTEANPRKPGHWRGQVQIREDFDQVPAGLAAAFRRAAP